MAKFTITTLKKQLAQKTKEELIQDIATLCKTFPSVKEYYKAQGSDIHDVLAKYKAIIEQEFVEGMSGKRRRFPKARFAVARKAITDFKKFSTDPRCVADVMLTYVESVSSFNSEYEPDSEEFYTRPEDMFEKVLSLIETHQLLDQFEARARDIVEHAIEGYGHYDSLKERYETAYGHF